MGMLDEQKYLLPLTMGSIGAGILSSGNIGTGALTGLNTGMSLHQMMLRQRRDKERAAQVKQLFDMKMQQSARAGA